VSLYSHPDKLLSTHIQEVSEASQLIAKRHTLDSEILLRLDQLVRLHDFGKATSFFQDYITFTPEPRLWPGRPEDKAHTAIGSLATAIWQRDNKLSPDWLIGVGASILGHHTHLPTRTDIDQRLMNNTATLVKQLGHLSLAQLSKLTAFTFDESKFEADENLVYEVTDIYEEAFSWLDKLTVEKAAAERLKTQLLFSILLEADKAFLALSPEARQRYSERTTNALSPTIVNLYLERFANAAINTLREQARANALEQLSKHREKNLYTLTLPTGLGKTLTALSLALELRQQSNRQIVVVLPFLSIVDQTAKVYTDVLGQPDETILIQSHSLSDRSYQDLEDGDADFFLDTWQSDLVITTFDQVLLALFSSRAKQQMRFHHLCDAILIFDEVQALPTHLWHMTQQAFGALTESFHTSIIAMSATQPGFINAAQELTPNVSEVFSHFGRYRLVLKHHTDMARDDFIASVLNRQEELHKKRVLITLNTRASARYVYDELKKNWQTPVFFLSADVTPKDRLAVIQRLKSNYPEPCLVISTQVIEAGVDIDMDLVMRDFAPLDSLIQVAGRCNRNNLKPRCNIEVYSLLGNNAKRYSERIYRKSDGSADISLQETRRVLEGLTFVAEENIRELCERYFTAIRQHDNLGQKHTTNWAYFREQLDVSKLLRGEQDQQHQFIVAERDDETPPLEEAVKQALSLKDRWEKRRALRQLATRLAAVTVNIWAKRGFTPERIAYSVGPFWFVHKGFYDIRRGLDTGQGSSEDSSFF
jgi:CRISPR-associated endonuclease/helicase Cas3